MGKSGKSTLEERINETVFPHLFEGIEAKCHICGSGRKRNLRPRIYLKKISFRRYLFVCDVNLQEVHQMIWVDPVTDIAIQDR